MPLGVLEILLKQTIGLDVSTVGRSTIERAVRGRIAACNLKDFQDYWKHVATCKAELQELVEAVVIPETWFFRDRGVFSALARIAQAEWARTDANRTFRLLSLPCSTGEEPYSMAMALLDSGLPASRFRIDAVDVSGMALARARCATYGKNSFRGNDLGFRDRYFSSTPNGYQLAANVQRQVHFEQGNLIDASFCGGAGLYDIIFCRNVLIYFDRPARDNAMGILVRRLGAQGVLFVAPSEANLLANYDLIPHKMERTSVFRKSALVPRSVPAPRTLPSSVHSPAISAPSQISGTRRPESVERGGSHQIQAQAQRPRDAQRADQHSLDEIRRLADLGQLDEAARLCEEHLRRNGASPETLHLLGLICEAVGKQREAADYYRKALYLDPNHYPTLVHLRMTLQSQGDVTGTKLLSDRLRRLEARERKQYA